MVSHPENGSDSPIGSDRDRGRDSLPKLSYQVVMPPFPGVPLITCQPAEYSWMSGNPTPLMRIGQSLLCTGNSTQNTTCPNHMEIFPNFLQRQHRVHIQLK